jgi:hypothetical protein
MHNRIAALTPFPGRSRVDDPPDTMHENDSPFLMRACHDAAQSSPADALEIVLRHLREATGAERAFLLEAALPPERTRVVAASALRPDDLATFSTSVAARALRGERPLFFAGHPPRAGLG